MTTYPVIPVILCGGSGTRLWPLSRESYPKQFLSIGVNKKRSLLQKTYLRIKGLNNISSPILVCNEKHRFIVAEQMREIEVKNSTILLEPEGRNTGPAITLAALKAKKENENSILLVLSSDHEIQNEENFINTLKSAIEYAKSERLVTFGIIPSSPETGYGYIKSVEPLIPNSLEGKKIEEFLEKPNYETAKKFLKDNRFSWNSGIFMFKAKTILNELETFSPNIVKFCENTINQSKKDLDFERLDKTEFAKCPNLSIDVAVLEKTNIGTVLPLNAGWSDVGSWEAVWEASNKDSDGNVIEGKVFTDKTQNCYLKSENRLLVGIGIKDLIIIETADAILISDKNSSQEVKNIVKKMKEKNITEGQDHTKIYRPWGHYLTVVEDKRWQLKLIYVKPGEQLSLQMHHHRSEHWIVVSGTAEVNIGTKSQVLTENQSVYIPLGTKHRLSNPGKIPLTLIEVQSGSYVGEDDIVRFEDKYGRSY